MTNVVPIFDESDGFIGLWMRNRQLEPSLGALAELMSLAEPTFKALDNERCSRYENHGVVRVGDNISFQDGAFLMLSEERPPPAAVAEGKSFVAISYHGISIAKRTDVRLQHAKLGRPVWKISKLKPALQIAVIGMGVALTLFVLSTPVWDRASRNDWHIIVPAAVGCFLIATAVFAAWKSDYQWFPFGVAARFVLLAGFVVPLLWGRWLAGQINAPVIGGLFICGLITALYGLLYWLADVERVFKSDHALTLTVLLLIVAALGLPGLFHSAPLSRQANIAGIGYIVAPLLWFAFTGYGLYQASRSTRS